MSGEYRDIISLPLKSHFLLYSFLSFLKLNLLCCLQSGQRFGVGIRYLVSPDSAESGLGKVGEIFS